MKKIPVRYNALALPLLGAGALLALVMTITAAAQPPPSLPSPHTFLLSSSNTAALSATPIPLPDPSWRIPIAADGLYRLSYETLAGAGVPVATTPPSAFHLLWRGQEVALQAVGDGDSVFESGESFLFYAVKFHGSVQDEKYTDENVYWLTIDHATQGTRMESRSVAPGGAGQAIAWYTATVHVEENTIYWARWSTTPGTDATWFWDNLRAPASSPFTYTYSITLTAPAPGVYTAALTVELADRSENSPHLRFTFNGTPIGETAWTGGMGWVATLPVSATLIQEGANTLDITVLAEGGTQWIYLNWIKVRYRRLPVAQDDALFLDTPLSGASAITLTGFSTAGIQLYDITHPLTPTRLVSGTAFLSGTTYALAASDTAPAGTPYLAVAEGAIAEAISLTIYHPPADLISPTVGADEIIIAPAEFITAIQPLADKRRSQGLRVRVVDVEDIYALFNGGVFHPEGIRAFVAHAYENWPAPAPAYLLLMGDGHFNFKYYNPEVYGDPVPVWIPPYLEFADPAQGEVPVDTFFGDVDEGGSGMPELMVGRIPVNSVAQTEGAVAKILAYEGAPRAAWMDRLIMVADNGHYNPEGFSEVLDDLAQDYVPDTIEVSTIYLKDYCGSPVPPYTTACPSMTLALTQTWNQGALMLTYAGHASVRYWAHERFLYNTQLAELTGTVGLPFLLSLDCWDGHWMRPPQYHSTPGQDVRSIGEWATTVLTDRGAIAAFGPAGLAYLGTEDLMAQAMYQAMFEDGVYQLGPLTQVGRKAITGNYLARTYTLFGDPAMRLATPSKTIYLPLVLQSY